MVFYQHTTPGGHYRVSNEDIEKLRETVKFNPNA